MGFIPDRGVSGKKEQTESNTKTVTKTKSDQKAKSKDTTSQEEKESKKKVVSYYLEIDLIDKVKSIADENDMYYSSLVTSALKDWITKKN